MFSKTDRTLMEMLFRRGTVNEISGVCKVGRYEQTYTIRFYPVTIFRPEEFYGATVTGIYGDPVDASTLTECLDKLEAMIADAA